MFPFIVCSSAEKRLVAVMGDKMNRMARSLLKRLPPAGQTVSKGLISYVPGVFRFADVTDSVSSRYCYTTWLKHLISAYDSGLDTDPKTIVEIGPGSSLGVGITAMLLGAQKYYALDVFPHAKEQMNLQVFDEVVDLINARADAWHEKAWEKIPFPTHILSEERLKRFMTPDRIASVREALVRAFSPSASTQESALEIRYICPWAGCGTLPPESADMIVSTVVLQVVDDLPGIYECFRIWLKPGGFMSHSVDFSSYGMTREWNGHWACSRLVWRLMRGNRPYLHNRAPHSAHIRLLKENGFIVVRDVKRTDHSGLPRESLAPEFRNISDEDLVTFAACILSVKPRNERPKAV
jgi:hypothetical protein